MGWGEVGWVSGEVGWRNIGRCIGPKGWEVLNPKEYL